MLEHGYAAGRAKTTAQNGAAVGLGPVAAGGSARALFRIAQLALLGQGLALGILGGFALAWSMANLRFGNEGIPILCLLVTPLHGGLLLAGGALAVLACLGDWTTAGYSIIAGVGWSALAVLSALGAAHHAPGALGFDTRDTVLYGVLAIYNLALCAVVVPVLRRKWRAAPRPPSA
ncbi:hypothetical protein [Mycolicibacterium sp. 050158]|uniref:hypothetical protein n=1 Tax=Mycolicibacterium sp. 050158 TaxID=3090602 RepID=UPI00299EB014|nr:hypothetical protein [Mycolicibacterium sp. 050158]MDX1890297.1 hypothetical protein [Mycolicibacterium sp. 050158]